LKFFRTKSPDAAIGAGELSTGRVRRAAMRDGAAHLLDRRLMRLRSAVLVEKTASSAESVSTIDCSK
jgi:hypothetical protein